MAMAAGLERLAVMSEVSETPTMHDVEEHGAAAAAMPPPPTPAVPFSYELFECLLCFTSIDDDRDRDQLLWKQRSW